MPATTYYVRTDGNDGNLGTANTAGGAFLTIAHAIAVPPASGDTIVVWNGTFDQGSGNLVVPAGVTMTGQDTAGPNGTTNTLITSSVNSVNKAIVSAATGAALNNFTVQSTGVALAQTDIPIGVGSAQTASTGVVCNNLTAIGDTDGFYWNKATCSWTLNNCTSRTKWDAYRIFNNAAITFVGCVATVVGPSVASPGAPARGFMFGAGAGTQSSTITGCSVNCSGGAGGNQGIVFGSNGNVTVDVTTTVTTPRGASDADYFVNTIGGIYSLSGKTLDSGVKIDCSSTIAITHYTLAAGSSYATLTQSGLQPAGNTISGTIDNTGKLMLFLTGATVGGVALTGFVTDDVAGTWSGVVPAGVAAGPQAVNIVDSTDSVTVILSSVTVVALPVVNRLSLGIGMGL